MKLLPYLRRCFLGAALTTLPVTYSRAVEYSTVDLEGRKAIVCRVDTRREKLELFLQDDAGHPLKSFAGVNQWLATKNRRLVFAMNAGMYHGNLAPVGLHASEGRQIAPLNLEKGEGNFFIKPNGVFLLTAAGPQVVESSECLEIKERIILATQSGPLLLRRARSTRCSSRRPIRDWSAMASASRSLASHSSSSPPTS